MKAHTNHEVAVRLCERFHSELCWVLGNLNDEETAREACPLQEALCVRLRLCVANAQAWENFFGAHNRCGKTLHELLREHRQRTAY